MKRISFVMRKLAHIWRCNTASKTKPIRAHYCHSSPVGQVSDLPSVGQASACRYLLPTRSFEPTSAILVNSVGGVEHDGIAGHEAGNDFDLGATPSKSSFNWSSSPHRRSITRRRGANRPTSSWSVVIAGAPCFASLAAKAILPRRRRRPPWSY